MNVLRLLLLLVLGVLVAGFGLCGAYGVLLDWQNFMAGCQGSYACMGWTFGWIGLGIAAVAALLFWLVRRFWKVKLASEEITP